MLSATRCTVVLSLFLLCSLTLLAQNVSVTDYQVPVSSAKQLKLNANYNWAQQDSVVLGNTFHSDLFFRSFYSSLPFAWNLTASGSSDHSAGNDWLNSSQASGVIRKYLADDQDWFGSAGLDYAFATHDLRPDLSGRIAAGYGRFINATALAKTVRIEDLLLKENVLKDHMPKETMIKIANIIERENEYSDLYGKTYEVQWFADIEKEIKASGTLVGPDLGAIGLFRVRQVLFPGQTGEPQVNLRYYGWDLSGGFVKKLIDRQGRDLGPVNLSVAGDYSYPLSWAMQLNFTAQANTPLDSGFFKTLDVTGNADYIYELSNRINFIANYAITFRQVQNSNLQRQHQLGASFLFYIENNINYLVGASYTKNGDSDVKSLNMQLQYNLFY